MLNLENQSFFQKVLDFEVPWAHTWADMRPGKTDKERRENFRKAAMEHLLIIPENILWWAFEIKVNKFGKLLDVDNVPKPIIDSFCIRQLEKDGSEYKALGLYPDDTLNWVRSVSVYGEPASFDSTRVQIFACYREPNA